MRAEIVKGNKAAKVVCYQCIQDAFLGRRIQRNGASSERSLCHSKRKCVPLTRIVDRVNEILRSYIAEAERVWRWSDGRIEHQAGDSLEHWVSEISGWDNVKPIVGVVCSRLTSYSDDIQ